MPGHVYLLMEDKMKRKILICLIITFFLTSCFPEEMNKENNEIPKKTDSQNNLIKENNPIIKDKDIDKNNDLEKNKFVDELYLYEVKFNKLDKEKLSKALDINLKEIVRYTAIKNDDNAYIFDSKDDISLVFGTGFLYYSLDRNHEIFSYPEEFEISENLNKELEFKSIKVVLEEAYKLFEELGLEYFKIDKIYGVEKAILDEAFTKIHDESQGSLDKQGEIIDEELDTSFLEDSYLMKFKKEIDDIPMKPELLVNDNNLTTQYGSSIDIVYNKNGFQVINLYNDLNIVKKLDKVKILDKDEIKDIYQNIIDNLVMEDKPEIIEVNLFYISEILDNKKTQDEIYKDDFTMKIIPQYEVKLKTNIDFGVSAEEQKKLEEMGANIVYRYIDAQTGRVFD